MESNHNATSFFLFAKLEESRENGKDRVHCSGIAIPVAVMVQQNSAISYMAN